MRTEGLIQGIVGSPTGPFEVVDGEIVLQLSHFRLHLLWVSLAFMVCQRFLSQDELIQFVRDIEISAFMIGHERGIELLCLQPRPIQLREPTVRPDLFHVRDATSAT